MCSATLPSPRSNSNDRNSNSNKSSNSNSNSNSNNMYENSLSNTPRNDSFASYLALVRDNLTTPHQFPITPTRLRPTPLHINLTRKRSDDDTEIDIFSADKYFNNASPNSPTPAPSTVLSQTTSAHSSQTQTTSNTRNVLLPHSRRRTLTSNRTFHLGAFGLWCSSCAPKHAPHLHKPEDQSGTTVSSNAHFIQQKQSVKQSPASWRIETSSPATWPSSQRRRQPPPPPPPAKFFEKEEDDRSESSSDLFEIESVGVSRAGYEPSEASIAWSVVTASAANVSVVSDRSEEIGRGRRRSSALLRVGCTSHKAVEVCSPVAPAEVGTSISPVVARYHVDLEVGGGSGRIVAGRANGTSWHGGSGRMIV